MTEDLSTIFTLTVFASIVLLLMGFWSNRRNEENFTFIFGLVFICVSSLGYLTYSYFSTDSSINVANNFMNLYIKCCIIFILIFSLYIVHFNDIREFKNKKLQFFSLLKPIFFFHCLVYGISLVFGIFFSTKIQFDNMTQTIVNVLGFFIKTEPAILVYCIFHIGFDLYRTRLKQSIISKYTYIQESLLRNCLNIFFYLSLISYLGLGLSDSFIYPLIFNILCLGLSVYFRFTFLSFNSLYWVLLLVALSMVILAENSHFYDVSAYVILLISILSIIPALFIYFDKFKYIYDVEQFNINMYLTNIGNDKNKVTYDYYNSVILSHDVLEEQYYQGFRFDPKSMSIMGHPNLPIELFHSHIVDNGLSFTYIDEDDFTVMYMLNF